MEPPPRYGNWNGNVELAMGAKHPSCGNPYYEYYQQLIKNNMEKKCTCGDTESQHYENTDKCVVCGCKEFEERIDAPGFEGTWEALDKLTQRATQST